MYKYGSEYLLDSHTRIRISYSERILNLTARNLCYVEAFFIGRIAETLPILHNLFPIGYEPIIS